MKDTGGKKITFYFYESKFMSLALKNHTRLALMSGYHTESYCANNTH